MCIHTPIRLMLFYHTLGVCVDSMSRLFVIECVNLSHHSVSIVQSGRVVSVSVFRIATAAIRVIVIDPRCTSITDHTICVLLSLCMINASCLHDPLDSIAAVRIPSTRWANQRAADARPQRAFRQRFVSIIIRNCDSSWSFYLFR
jgi:hypothetical protein